MKPITILCVGDRADFDSFKKLHRERRIFSKSRIAYRAVSYRKLLSGSTPEIATEKVLVFLFFPFEYWNMEIEHRSYRGLYGNALFYTKFVLFYKDIDAIIKKALDGKVVRFVNTPRLSAMYRDKLKLKKIMLKKGLPTPRLCRAGSPRAVYRHLEAGRSLYIKPRYGSMGKGITFIGPSGWKTNFLYRGRRILSRKSDYGWRFRDVTGKDGFLERLLRGNFYIEESVEPLLIKGRRFDLRVYVFFGEVLFIYPKTNEPDKVTTNISQEGRGERPGFLRSLPGPVIARVKRVSIRAAKALGLNFAGVDIIVGANLRDVYLIDVNIFPGFPKRRTFNMGRHIVRRLKRRATRRYL